MELISSLEELNERLEETAYTSAAVISRMVSAPAAQQIHSLTDPAWASAPDKVKDLYVRTKQLTNRANFHFFQISHTPTEAARLQLAIDLLDDREQVNENWRALKQYHETGNLRETAKPAADKFASSDEKPVDQLSILELTKELNNLNPYLSKNRKLLATLPVNGDKYKQVASRIASKEQRLLKVKERLDNVAV